MQSWAVISPDGIGILLFHNILKTREVVESALHVRITPSSYLFYLFIRVQSRAPSNIRWHTRIKMSEPSNAAEGTTERAVSQDKEGKGDRDNLWCAYPSEAEAKKFGGESFSSKLTCSPLRKTHLNRI